MSGTQIALVAIGVVGGVTASVVVAVVFVIRNNSWRNL